MSADGETVQVETRAREMGWIPKEQFRGDPEKWTDAAEFVRRGEELMPILKASNKRLNQEVQELRTKAASLEQTVVASQEAIEELKTANTQIAIDKAKAKVATLKAALVKAKEDDDAAAEVELTEQLAEHSAAIREAEKVLKPSTKSTEPATHPAKGTPPNPMNDPVFRQWADENPWFGTNIRRTALANGIADELRASPQYRGMTGRQFLDAVTDELEKVWPSNRAASAPSKVGETRNSGNGAGGDSGGARGFSSLPPEIKETCDRLGKKLIGKGKQFETQDAWRKHYATKYYEE